MKTRKAKHTADCKELQPMVGKDEGYVCICEGGKHARKRYQSDPEWHDSEYASLKQAITKAEGNKKAPGH